MVAVARIIIALLRYECDCDCERCVGEDVEGRNSGYFNPFMVQWLLVCIQQV